MVGVGKSVYLCGCDDLLVHESLEYIDDGLEAPDVDLFIFVMVLLVTDMAGEREVLVELDEERKEVEFLEGDLETFADFENALHDHSIISHTLVGLLSSQVLHLLFFLVHPPFVVHHQV